MTHAQAEEKTLQVTATVLPRNSCVLDLRLAELRCTGADARVPFRVIREMDSGETYVSAPAAAPRGGRRRLAIGRHGVVTIEF